MERRRLAELCGELNIDFRFYRPRHAAPPRLMRPLLRSWLARILVPPAPMQARMIPLYVPPIGRRW
jgi:hypothetical protein